jgi:hypothetical protein
VWAAEKLVEYLYTKDQEFVLTKNPLPTSEELS